MLTGIPIRLRLVTLLIVVMAITLAVVSPAVAAQANGPTAQSGLPASGTKATACTAAELTAADNTVYKPTPWTNGTVPFQKVGLLKYDANGNHTTHGPDTDWDLPGSKGKWPLVVQAMQAWTDATGGFIQFRPKVDGDTAWIDFPAAAPWNSDVGMVGPGQHCGGDTLDAALHELGHALGLGHTNSRFDRDRYLNINKDIYCNATQTAPKQCLPVGVYCKTLNAGTSYTCDYRAAGQGGPKCQPFISTDPTIPPPDFGPCCSDSTDPNDPQCNVTDKYCGYKNLETYKGQLRGDNLTRFTENSNQDLGPFDWDSKMLYRAGFPPGISYNATKIPGCDPTNPTYATCGILRRKKVDNSYWYPSIPEKLSVGDGQAVIQLYRLAEGWSIFKPAPTMDNPPTEPLTFYLDGAGKSITMLGSPALTIWSKQYQQLVAIALGSNKKYYYTVSDQGGKSWPRRGWISIGGQYASSPAAVSWGEARFDVVGVGTDGDVWHTPCNNFSCAAPNSIGRPNVSGELSAPAISSWGSDRLDVFVRVGTHIYWKYWGVLPSTGKIGWSGWSDLGGSYTGKPAAVSWGPNRIDLFGVSTGNKVWHRAYKNKKWGGGENLGGNIQPGTGPAVASPAPGKLNVFVSASGARDVWFRSYSSGAWDGGFSVLGGVLGTTTFPGSPSAVSMTDPSGIERTFFVGPITEFDTGVSGAPAVALEASRGMWTRYYPK
jgi:hypothetical protein